MARMDVYRPIGNWLQLFRQEMKLAWIKVAGSLGDRKEWMDLTGIKERKLEAHGDWVDIGTKEKEK